MKRALVAILVGCTALGFASFASAGNNAQAGIAVHIGPLAPAKNICDSAGYLEDNLINYNEATCEGDYSVYLLVCNGSHRNAEVTSEYSGDGFDVDGTGVSGADLGIQYGANVSAFGWTYCADLGFEQANWPDSGYGGTWVWDLLYNCQGIPSPHTAPNEVIAVIGVLNVTVTGPDAVQVTINPNSGEAAVIDCNAANDAITPNSPSHLGVGGFCSAGYNPCGTITPIQETTWGAIKKQFD